MNKNLFQPGHKFSPGRRKGSKNKKTIERTEKERQVLENTSALTRLARYIVDGLDDGSLKYSEAIKAYDVFAKFYIKTTSQDQDDEIIESMSRNDAEQVANTLRQRLEKLLPEPIQEDDEE